MNAVLTPRDWQLLSEYLDNQLGPGIRTQVEKNVSTSAEWSAGLQSLESTRLALRSAPRRRAPRNYTLTTLEAASYRQARFSFPIFKLSSAFSAVLTILFLVLGLTSRTSSAVPMMAAAPAMDRSMESTTNVTAVPIIIWGSPDMNQYAFGGVGSATGMGGGGGGAEGMGRGGGAGISGAEAAPMVGKSADTTAAEPGIDSMATVEAPALAIEPAPETALAPMALAPQLTEMPTQVAVEAIPSESGNPILGIQPAEKSLPEEQPVPVQETNPISPWWFAALGCLVISIFLGYLGWKPSRL
jgi:hypothetical protein